MNTGSSFFAFLATCFASELDAFNDLFLTCLNAHAPVKTVKLKRKPNPFITDDIKDLMKSRDSMRRKARRTGSVNDWQVFRDLKREVNFFLRKAEKEYFNEQICANKNNTGAICKTIRHALPKKSSCTTHYIKDPSILTSEFKQFFFFISVGVNAAEKTGELAWSLGLTDYLPSCSNNSPTSGKGLFDFKPVSRSEVPGVLTVMPSNKALGYERIPLFVIKDCLPPILPTLTRQINSSFACSEFPKAWKKSVIVPHLKDGAMRSPVTTGRSRCFLSFLNWGKRLP